MNKNFISLYKKYQAIRKMDWIENMRNGYSGIGYTFETLIGKEEDTLPIPDYGEIEIKVNRTFSKNEIHLFTTVPDGDYLFPMERVLEKLGYPDKKYNFFKVLNMDFNCKEYTHIGKYRMAKIEIDRNNNKINLVAKDFKGQTIDVGISWSFNLLRERLYLKLKELVIIEANVKKI